VISIFGIIILSPLVVLYSFYLLIFKKINPILIQDRGISFSNGRIKLFKLRTMVNDPALFYEESESLKKMSTSYPYLPLGKFLRKTGLDEVPQLLHVLSGKMSLIGPRPLLISDLARMNKSNSHYLQSRDNLNSKPGISGLWQLFRNSDMSFSELISLDIKYETQKSVFLELKLLVKTLLKIIKSDHSDTING
jgi:lipopolysaccharide/colanic/teichoic acid biosynthesis glycosyltransferase